MRRSFCRLFLLFYLSGSLITIIGLSSQIFSVLSLPPLGTNRHLSTIEESSRAKVIIFGMGLMVTSIACAKFVLILDRLEDGKK